MPWPTTAIYRGSTGRVRQLCAIAGLDEALALDWPYVRTIDYLFWALDAGLTTDPQICRELLDHLSGQDPKRTFP